MQYELRFLMRHRGGWRYGGRYRSHKDAARALQALRRNWRVRRVVLVSRKP